MDISAYRDEIKLKITGGVLNLELDDKTLDSLINASLREIQRYCDSTKLITIPYSRCIDMTKYNVSAVARIYRVDGFTGDSANTNGMVDPMFASQWQLLSGTGNLYNFSDYVYNYAAWNTLMQVRNTTSTDLSFFYDKSGNKLYINVATNYPTNITIEYIPRYNDVSELVSDYWIDMLIKLAVALTKVTLGRVRSRFTQSNALWSQDGDKLLEEGNAELSDLRERLVNATQLAYPID